MKRVSTAERLKNIMKEKNLKQIDILNLCGPFCQKFDVKMNKSDISQYVAGKVEPSQDKLVILGMALDVTESWLMGFDVPPERNIKSPKPDKIPSKHFSLSPTETEIILKFRQLTNGERNMFLRSLGIEEKNDREKMA